MAGWTTRRRGPTGCGRADDRRRETTSAIAPAGPAVRDGHFEFVVTKFEQGTTHLGDRFWNADVKGEFVLVYISVSNIGKKPQTLLRIESASVR